ncbi:hypothetical protein AAF143_16755 [Cyanobium sp. ATX-6F1]
MARQGDLFDPQAPLPLGATPAAPELPLLRHQLEQWQQRLIAFQRPLFEAASTSDPPRPAQATLFAHAAVSATELAAAFAPLALTPQHLQFWRWPSAPQRGPPSTW